MKKFKFCPFCGSVLGEALLEGRDRLSCGKCGWINYISPIPVVSCLVADARGGILLVKRGIEPSKGAWALPGGFFEVEESPEDAGKRELKEETGIDGVAVRQVGITTHLSPLYGHLIIIGIEYKAECYEVEAGDDAEDARFYSPEKLPDIPFTSHLTLIHKFLGDHC
jgi:8-oxo-dGTP diphosphatase